MEDASGATSCPPRPTRCVYLRRSAEPVLGKPAALRVLGLTPERAREWNRRALECQLEDAPSCPKQTPQQLTTKERQTIRKYVTDFALRHLSVASLALLAARRGDAITSASTWYREVRRQGDPNALSVILSVSAQREQARCLRGRSKCASLRALQATALPQQDIKEWKTVRS